MLNKIRSKATQLLAKIAETASKAKNACKAAVVAAGALVVSAQNSYAQTGLELPTEAKNQLEGYITANFPTVISVVCVMVGAVVLIKLIRKAS
jgi:hypothetical protein